MKKITVLSLLAVLLVFTSCVEPPIAEVENPLVGTWVRPNTIYDQSTTDLFIEKLCLNEDFTGSTETKDTMDSLTYIVEKINGVSQITVSSTGNESGTYPIEVNTTLDYFVINNKNYYYKQNIDNLVGAWTMKKVETTEKGSYTWRGTYTFTNSSLEILYTVLESTDPDNPVSTTREKCDYFIKRNTSTNMTLYYSLDGINVENIDFINEKTFQRDSRSDLIFTKQ